MSGGRVPFWLGGAVVALVVMSYVFFGGMRGTAWVNTFQTILFLLFGAIAVAVIGARHGRVREPRRRRCSPPRTPGSSPASACRPRYFFSYTFIPLSSIAFPHITIFCLTARRMAQFKKTVIFYPLCIMAIWLPCVLPGRDGQPRPRTCRRSATSRRRGRTLAREGRDDARGAGRAARAMEADDVLLLLLARYAPVWLAGLLGAGIMAAVMATDSQILALSTMFTEDVLTHYGGKQRFGEAAQVQMARGFVVLLTVIAYFDRPARCPRASSRSPSSTRSPASRRSFPLLVAALFWRGSTKWGALASTLWVAAAVVAVAVFQAAVPAPPAGPPTWSSGSGRSSAGPHRRGHGGLRLHARGADGARSRRC